MTKVLKYTTFFSLILLGVSPGIAAPSGSFPLLKMAPDARSVAMGETGIAGAKGAFSLFHNPALMTFSETSQAGFAYTDWLLDLSMQSGALCFKRQNLSIGLSFNVFNTPGLERRVLPSDDPLATFSAHDLAAGLSLAYLWQNRLSLGITGRYLYQQIDVNDANGIAGDLGLAYRLNYRNMVAAASIRNMGQMQALLTERTPLPSEASLGLSGDIYSKGDFCLRAQADGQYLLDDDLRLHAGLECDWRNQIFLRGGYQTGSELRTFSGGLGLAWQRFHFDYAYQPLAEDFQASHRFALSIDF
ncbi:MAG: PorV/PorQ family protein [bacterium]|nr:PorV/PorQ family protein [bacterium]